MTEPDTKRSERTDALVESARSGDSAALDSLLRGMQPELFRLSLHFLWHPEDAEDATQEILLRIANGLGRFRGDCTFRTWAYRVARNTLFSLKAQRMERRALSFDEFGADLEHGLCDLPLSDYGSLEQTLLLEEVKISCTLAMLLCLDREHRLAYIVGEVLDLDHNEGAAILEVSPAAFRKRLSRSRKLISSVMLSHCGLVEPANRCRCRKRVRSAITLGRVDPARLKFASSLACAKAFPRVLSEIRNLEALRRAREPLPLPQTRPVGDHPRPSRSRPSEVRFIAGLCKGFPARPERD